MSGARRTADDHEAKETNPVNKGAVTPTRLLAHDVLNNELSPKNRVNGLGGVEREGGGRKAVGDQIHPQEGDGDEHFGDLKGSRKEDADNVGGHGGGGGYQTTSPMLEEMR
jgi:hypothetical protein